MNITIADGYTVGVLSTFKTGLDAAMYGEDAPNSYPYTGGKSWAGETVGQVWRDRDAVST